MIFLSDVHFFSFSMGYGCSSNTRAELLALWAILRVSKLMGLPMHRIFGDSLVIISWLNIIASLNVPSLIHWCDDIHSMLLHVSHVIFKHIYHEHNSMGDGLSKQALKLNMGHGISFESLERMIIDHGQFMFF